MPGQRSAIAAAGDAADAVADYTSAVLLILLLLLLLILML
jgi:hypothetical protein